MKSLAILTTAIFLAGCATKPDTGFTSTEVVVKKEYVVRTAPDAMKALPPLPKPLTNPQTATNNQVAAWINETERYTADLEAMIRALVVFYEKPVAEPAK